MRSITVIINPVSGGGTLASAQVRARLAADVIAACGAFPEVFITERPGHARELAAAAVTRGAERVCAWGGDGTLNEVATALAFTDVALGVVPSGSGNGLARELGIPLQAPAALDEAVRAEVRPIDLGEIDGRLFINIAGIGLDAHIASLFNSPANLQRGFTGYARLAAAAVLRYVADEYVIETPRGRRRTRALFVTVANSPQWGNNARIAPEARVDDGLLDLVTIADRSAAAMIWHAPRLFTGSIGRMRGYAIEQIQSTIIESTRPIPFHVDGEPTIGGNRVEIRVRPGAIKIAGGRSRRP